MSVAALTATGAAKPPGGFVPWGLISLSMVVLPLENRLGSSAIGVFLLLWIGYGAAWPSHALNALRHQALPWLFPAVAIFSTTWSIAPAETLRHGLQLTMTTAVTILLARSATQSQFVAALTLALVPVSLIGMVGGGHQITETGAPAATGLFDSKNMFAQNISLMLFASIGTLANRKQPGAVRVMALVGLAAAPVLLWAARSIGALVTAVPCILLMLVILSLAHLPRRFRPLAVFCYIFVLLLIGGVIAFAIMTEREMLLGLLGKGGGLTGRDVLWNAAGFLIRQHPALGVGYQGFWIQGNLDAEGLWRAEHIPSRSGFHFHSYYYETVIELGYIGFLLVTTQFVVMALTIIVWGLRVPSGESAFFCGIAAFYALRAPVEVDFTAPFGLTALLIPAGWLYAVQAGERRWL